jgi:diguanylate cyclase (GGDEF)-like protein
MRPSISCWTSGLTGCCHAGAALLLTPFLLVSCARLSFAQVIRKQPGVFLISTAASILAVGYLLFGTSGIHAADAGASFLILLPLLWMAVRLSLRVAYPVFFIVMITTIAGTMSGLGPFYGVERGGTLVIFAQMAIGFGSSVLLLGGAANEQRAAEDELRKLNLDLEGRVERRTGELREIQRQLEKAAFYDPLTGLPNGRLLEERFAFCAAAARRKIDRFTILLIDLDHFKLINDNCGHDAGDAMLIETGNRLLATFRESDVVSRIGGDEFVVLLPETSDHDVVDVICRRILIALAEPVEFNGHQLTTSSSIGVARYPEHGPTWQAIYKAADLAVYHAKRAGRRTWQWYVPEVSTAQRD